MVTEEELHDELENDGPYSAFPEENGWEVAMEVFEELYISNDPQGVAKLADTLDRDHAPIRSALVHGEEAGYLEASAYGEELTEKGKLNLQNCFPTKNRKEFVHRVGQNSREPRSFVLNAVKNSNHLSI